MNENFEKLCKDFCASAGIAGPMLTPTSQQGYELVLDVDDVQLGLAFDERRSATHVFVTAGLDQPPEHLRLRAYRHLVDTNFQTLYVGTVVVCRDPSTGELLLQYAYPLAQANAQRLGAGALVLADLVHRWRADFTLGGRADESMEPQVAPQGDHSIGRGTPGFGVFA